MIVDSDDDPPKKGDHEGRSVISTKTKAITAPSFSAA